MLTFGVSLDCENVSRFPLRRGAKPKVQNLRSSRPEHLGKVATVRVWSEASRLSKDIREVTLAGKSEPS